MHLFTFLLTLFATCACVINAKSCTTPNGAEGQCISVYECQPLLNTPFHNNRSPQDREFIKKFRCGVQDNVPMVCCPSEVDTSPSNCINPDGNPGRCVDISQCKHLAERLKPPITTKNVEYLQKFKCASNTEYSVCCGPEPVKPTTPQSHTSCRSALSAYPPDPSTGCCGIEEIPNPSEGTPVKQYPWLVLIDYTKSRAFKQLCGGALISSRYVLTAAHCLAGEILKLGIPRFIRLGAYANVRADAECAPDEAGTISCTSDVTWVPIESTTPHPDYDPVGKKNDIGLIRLGNTVPFTDSIRPICLPSTDLTLYPPINFTLFVAGRNQQTSKLHVDLPFVTLEQCQVAYIAPDLHITLWDHQLCAGGRNVKDACKGRSGGPLMYKNGETHEIIGVINFGSKRCGMMNIPEVFTKVFAYRSWILSNIKN